jgi:hemerythrin-like domain-containing protein
MSFKEGIERRQVLAAFASSATLLVSGCASTAGARRGGPKADEKIEEEVSPGEDLMREHGVLERVLLIYEESATRLVGQGPAPVEVLKKSAGIVRRFVEDYHERLEEQFLFPRFEAAHREAELVRTLRVQHGRGRELTDQILRLVSGRAHPGGAERAKLAEVLRSFSRMVRPHAACEDTVLFPAFRELIGAPAYRELGEQFEEREHAKFGKNGFADVVREVARLEEALGIHDLARFTTPG